MNLLILEDQDFLSPDLAEVTGRRHQHLQNVLRLKVGDGLSVGRLGGAIGRACVVASDVQTTRLQVFSLDRPSPPTLPLILILALPRPKMLQRTLQTIATMGVEQLHLIHTERVEKSFWQTPLLQPESVHQHLLLGLEQAKATQLPQIHYHRKFRDFMTDALPSLSQRRRCLIAHPGDYPGVCAQADAVTTLAVGPEGGFIEREVSGFIAEGFAPVQLGQRILRVETAVPVLLGKLF